MPEEGITFGAPILETLTTGMYREPLTVFREYVQNSCDSIDAAINAGIIHDGEGRIDIAIDFEARRITITDNGTGIKASDFRRVMGNIADSDKRQAESRGFRGIGRLCGIAYCRTLTFTAKFKGEGVISRLVCDGGVLRELLHESDSGINRYTASEVLGMINEFNAENVDDIDGHYFRVELDGINDENTSLLDFDGVRDYLSFVAPLPYSNNFIVFRSEIHRHAEGLGFKIDEYDIFLNGEQLFKEYKTVFSLGRSRGGDEIYSIRFEDFKNIDNRLVAWMWFGVSNFKGAIDERCLMRGIRLRKGNIQIGNEHTLIKLFTEPRGINYFIGEIFCVSDDLIPNSQRDYFNENSESVNFWRQLKNFCHELSTIYHDGSTISSSFRKIEAADSKKAEIIARLDRDDFSSESDRYEAKKDLQTAEEEAAKAREEIEKIKRKRSPIFQDIIRRMEERDTITPAHIGTPHTAPANNPTYKQKLLSKVFDIIRSTLDSITAERLITRIQDKLK